MLCYKMACSLQAFLPYGYCSFGFCLLFASRVHTLLFLVPARCPLPMPRTLVLAARTALLPITTTKSPARPGVLAGIISASLAPPAKVPPLPDMLHPPSLPASGHTVQYFFLFPPLPFSPLPFPPLPFPPFPGTQAKIFVCFVQTRCKGAWAYEQSVR